MRLTEQEETEAQRRYEVLTAEDVCRTADGRLITDAFNVYAPARPVWEGMKELAFADGYELTGWNLGGGEGTTFVLEPIAWLPLGDPES